MLSRLSRAALAPVACSLITACFGDAAASERSEPVDRGVPILVRPATPITRRNTISASGSVEPRARSDVAFQVPGRVSDVHVDEGSRVAAGQLLAALDRRDYELSLEQARIAGRRASDEARRARVLRASDGIAPNEFDKILSAEAQANVAAAMAEKRLADTRLVSPLGGIVARRATNLGETVPAGVAVFTIVDLDVVHARVAVPESDVGVISTGSAATVTVPSLGDTAVGGRVRLVGVAADPVARTYPVEIEVPNPGHRLKAGMIVEASIETGRRSTRLTVPASAIVRDAEGATQLFIYSSTDRRVHARRITPGAIAGDNVEIANGLAAGELVVVGGQQRLRDGAGARPMPAPGARSATPEGEP